MKDTPGGRKKRSKGEKVKISMTNAYTCKGLSIIKAKEKQEC